MHEYAFAERRTEISPLTFNPAPSVCMQTTSNLLMIRPAHFGYNAETAVNNAFQVEGDQSGVATAALAEFDRFVEKLIVAGIEVTVVEDSSDPHTPDAIFPNNWISFHEEGLVCLFPMFAPNRRLERKGEVLDLIEEQFIVNKKHDFSGYEKHNRFLEGTGSMVLDRDRRIAYACLSPRTDADVLDDFCNRTGYTPCVFHATGSTGLAIYHTNVMMCVADRFVVICLDSVSSEAEKSRVISTIEKSGKERIDISLEQMNHFAGNMLQVRSRNGKTWLLMSAAAEASLTPAQTARLTAFSEIISSSLTVIETNGGGSARCMMAEVFLERR